MPTYLRFMAYLLPDTQGLEISGCNHNTEYGVAYIKYNVPFVIKATGFSLKQTLDKKKSQHNGHCVCRWMHMKFKKFHLLYGNNL